MEERGEVRNQHLLDQFIEVEEVVEERPRIPKERLE